MKRESAKTEVTAVTAKATASNIIEKKKVRRGVPLDEENEKRLALSSLFANMLKVLEYAGTFRRKHLGIGGPAEAPSDSGFIQNVNSPENMNGYFKYNTVFPFAGQTKRQEVESDKRDRRYGNSHFLAEQSELLHYILEMKNLRDRLQSNRQIISTNDMFLIARSSFRCSSTEKFQHASNYSR